jgi:hypothetical protein
LNGGLRVITSVAAIDPSSNESELAPDNRIPC